ncbi:hypothetical protein [Agrococcus citreus]|uniref:Pilus assembly protein, PilO n=1 Tax=Agrococcus citreus TaxID=84643 RepID=A0ABP4JRC9_9MICO
MNTADRLWSLGAGLVAIGVAAGAWFGVISPDLSTASVARDDLETAEHQNSLHELRIASLEEAAARIGEFEASRDELAQGLPGELRYAEFMRQIDALAVQTGVTIVNVGASEALPYLPPVEAEQPVEAEPAAETDGAAAADAEATPAAAEPAAVAAPMPHVDPSIGPENLAAVPVAIAVTGEAIEIEAFLHELQMGPRLVTVKTASFIANAQADIDAVAVANPDAGPGLQSIAEDPWGVTIGGYLYVLQPEANTP